MSTLTDTPALELKGGLYTLTAIRLYSANLDLLAKQLEDKIKQAPKFFYYAPVIIDLSQFKDDLPQQPEKLISSILECIRQFHLIPIGIIPMQGAPEILMQTARMLGVATISESRKMTSNASPQKEASDSTAAHSTPQMNEPEIGDPIETQTDVPQITPTRTVIQPVRSGQQIYAPNGDLLVLNSVSHGAELLADGHIHVYGPLRGRALAGISGNEEAHIFCQSLEAELVSIAGRYKISEDLKDNPLWKQPVRIFLEKGKLQITKL
jgi:septum site-determining protein MinC